MEANTRRSGISFLRFVVALVVLLLGGPGGGFGQGKTAQFGKQAMPGSAVPAQITNWTGPKIRLAVMDFDGSALKAKTNYAPAATQRSRGQREFRFKSTKSRG